MNFVEKTGGRGRGVFDMTPMIDVVLQLIIFFLYTSQFSQATRTRLDLPGEAGVRATQDQRGVLVVDVTADGRLIVEGQDVTLDRLGQMVRVEVDRAGAGGGAGTPVELLVRADKAAAASHINRLATMLRAAGVRAWKLATAEQRGGGG